MRYNGDARIVVSTHQPNENEIGGSRFYRSYNMNAHR